MKKGCWIALVALVLAVASLGAIGATVWVAGGGVPLLLLRAEFAQGAEAANLYREALALRGPEYDLYMKLGEALEDVDEPAQAVEAWEKAAQIDPEEPEPLLEIAELALDEDDVRAAEDAVKRALDRAPDSWRAHSLGGMAASRREDYSRAVEQFNEALELGGPENEVCYPLGQAWEDLGDTDEAIQAYERGTESCDSRCRERLGELRADGDAGEAPERAEGGTAADERDGDNEREENDMEPFAGVLFGVFFLAYFGFIALVIAVSWGGYIAAALAIYDCSQRDFPSPQTRGAWCLLLFIGQWLGAIIYYFAVYRPDTPRRIPQEVRS